MKRSFTAVGALFLLGISQVSFAIPIAYISNGSQPWGQQGNIQGMNNVFGAGQWDNFTFANAVGNGIFLGGYDYLFIDGSDGGTASWNIFMNDNRTNLEAYVSSGGNLFNNAYRQAAPTVFDFGFGWTGSDVRGSGSGNAVDPLHPIIVGPFGNANPLQTGSFLSNTYFNELGNVLFRDSLGRATLAEQNYGGGHVMVGGMTMAFMGQHVSWGPTSAIFRDNMIAHGNQAQAVPEPGTLALFGIGLAGLVGFGRRKKAQKIRLHQTLPSVRYSIQYVV